MPTTVLSRQRSWIALLAVLAMVASLMVIATPAQAALQDTSATCPDSIPSAGFTDLGGLDAATVQAIDCLAFYGISQGTSATTYSPNASVARWQMALFLTRSLTTMGVALPDGSDQGFTDIGGMDAATQVAVNQLAQLNITKGTSATTFSPTDNVSRWQMALFLTRTLSTAGNVLPDGSSQGFTDIGAYDAATQTAINQTVQLGVSNGTSATTYSPDPDTLRWHMALFLTRSLAADGVVASGVGNPITAWVDATNKITYSSGGALTTDTYLSTDSFFVDGAAATLLAFEANITIGDLISIVGDVWSLTNSSATSSGLISNVDMVDNFDFTEPVSGAVTKTWDYDADAFDLYTVDGTSATLSAFNADISLGDTVVVSGGNGTTAAKTRIFSLTNASASGTVGGATATTFMLKPAGGAQWVDVIAPAVADALTVDGVVVTEAVFEAAVSNSDTATYSRTGGKQTISLTNQAPAAITGLARDFFAATDVHIAYGSGSEVIVFHATDGKGGGPVASYAVNGSVATQVNFEAALTLGDTVTWQADNPATTADESMLSLVDGAFTGIPQANATTASVFMNKVASVGFDYTSAVAVTAWTGLSVTGSGETLYSIDGGTAAVYGTNGAAFDAAVNLGNVQNKGTLSVAKVGNDVVWSVTTS